MDKSIKNQLTSQALFAGVNEKNTRTTANGNVFSYRGSGIVTMNNEEYYLAEGHGPDGTPEMVFSQGYISLKTIEQPSEQVRAYIVYRNLLAFTSGLYLRKNYESIFDALMETINKAIAVKSQVTPLTKQDHAAIIQRLSQQPEALNPNDTGASLVKERDEIRRVMLENYIPALPTQEWIEPLLTIYEDINRDIVRWNEKKQREQAGIDEPDMILQSVHIVSMQEFIENAWGGVSCSNICKHIFLSNNRQYEKPRERSHELRVPRKISPTGHLSMELEAPSSKRRRKYSAEFKFPYLLLEMADTLERAALQRDKKFITVTEAKEILTQANFTEEQLRRPFDIEIKFIPEGI